MREESKFRPWGDVKDDRLQATFRCRVKTFSVDGIFLDQKLFENKIEAFRFAKKEKKNSPDHIVIMAIYARPGDPIPAQMFRL